MSAPAALTARAVPTICSQFSTAHGPAIITTRGPPMVTGPTRTGVGP